MIADRELHKLFKAESDEHIARLDDGLLRLEKTPTDQKLLDEIFRESHSMKGAARMLGLTRVESAAHSLENSFNAARKGKTALTAEAIEEMNASLRDLRQRVQEALADEARPDIQPESPPEQPIPDARAQPVVIAPPPQPNVIAPVPKTPQHPKAEISDSEFRIETVRVETRKLDDLLTQVGELSVIQGQAQHRLRLIGEILEQWSELNRAFHGSGENASPYRPNQSEALLRLGRSLKQARDAFFDDTARLESLVHLLEDRVSSIRLLPLSTLFALFPRMVHDLAKEQGKSVELVLEGGDISVDKRILEEMKDPIMHLLRNAVDHGIESPDERSRLNKPQTARLRIRAIREDASLLLEVSDDGRGLDLQAIAQEAYKRGLVDEVGLSGMTPVQIQQLVFTSGFSTSRFVTELSGRGVGLDIVRTNVERLKGNIHLESNLGRGLAVQLRLPFSIATTRLLLADVNGRYFGLPVEFIHTSRWVHPEEFFMLDGHKALLLNGEPVFVNHLADLLELPVGNVNKTGANSVEAKQLACTVLFDDYGRLGILVDDLPGEEEVVLKPLTPPLKRVRNVSALAMLASGTICPVLNPSDLLRSAQKRMLAIGTSAPDRIEIRTESARPVILLAEDSALIRAMEKRILEDANYEVVTAVDGLAALNLIGSRSFAALVTDIVMPNMDGLTLVTHIRSNPRYRDLPVILVTSLASDEDKRRGLEVGANAYIPKPTFDQRVLLDTLKRLITS